MQHESYAEKISEDFVKKYKSKIPPFGPVGFITFKRTYARRVEGENRTEEWWETVRRCCNGIISVGGKFTKEEIELLYDKVFNFKCCFSGRALWQLGTETVRKLGGDSLINCWAVAIDHPIDPFCFAFNELMLGGGVGFNIQAEQVYSMPKVKHDVQIVRRDEKDVDFIVPDNREGWVELLRRTLNAFFFTGKGFSYSTICVRGKGSLIQGFGGVASGPEDLCRGISQIIGILKGKVGNKLKPIDCLDIMNIIGSVVVAGNIRRSALLALGDANDRAYLDAKNWGKGQIPNWRSMSNNSVVCNKYDELPNEFWSGYNGEGEPYGLVNLKNCRLYGRLADGKDYRPDKHVIGTNPCGEIPLENMACCNLVEMFLPNIKDEEEFKTVAGLVYKVAKTVSTLNYQDERTNEVVSQGRRLGLGVTGFLQAPHLHDEKIFDSVYKHIEKLDKEFSKTIGVKPSIKLTTCKPSGTASLLPGVTPGVHPAFAPYYIRRIRIASADPLVETCRKHGYHIEPLKRLDGTNDLDTMVVSFPIKTPDGTICAKDITAIQQLEHAKWLQTNWSDNSVSVTVYYKKEELPAIKDWLKANYDKYVKTVSFCLHTGHGFIQAPYEEIVDDILTLPPGVYPTASEVLRTAEDKYKEMIKTCKPITHLAHDQGGDLAESLECAGGSCPIK